jgi:hypothetical protein
MAKAAENAFIDGALNILKTTAIRQVVCSSQPSGSPPTVAQINTVRLAEVVMANADFTVADGDTSGRKVTMTAKAGVPITAPGSATHVVLDNGTNGLYCTTCTSVALTSGNTVNIPTWKIEIADPT